MLRPRQRGARVARGRSGTMRACVPTNPRTCALSPPTSTGQLLGLRAAPLIGSSRGSFAPQLRRRTFVCGAVHGPFKLGGRGRAGDLSQPGSNDPMALTRARIDDAGVHVRVALVVKAMSTQEKVVGAKNQGNSLSSMFMNPCPSSSNPRTRRSASNPPRRTWSACASPPAGTSRARVR